MEPWISTYTAVHAATVDAGNILSWYKESSNPAENPALLIGVDEEVKPVFEYIIGGFINAKTNNNSLDVVDAISKLKAYYDFKCALKKNELVIFELILEANYIIGDTLNFDKTFMPMPLFTVVDDKSVPKLCDSELKTKMEIPQTLTDDFVEHFKPQLIHKLGINTYLGVKNNIKFPKLWTNEIKFFISKLIDINSNPVLTAELLEDLNELQENAENSPFNNEANYKYEIKISHTWVRIILSILATLKVCVLKNFSDEKTDPKEKTESYKFLDTQIKPIKEFLLDMIVNGIYKRINRKGDEVPKELFFDFYNRYLTTPETELDEELIERVSRQMLLLEFVYLKLEKIFAQSEILEIKTKECLYDLFDSLEVSSEEISIDKTTNEGVIGNKKPFVLDSEGKKVLDDSYPLRTVHFRSDFIIAPPMGITIDNFFIPKDFWIHVDETVCWRKKPLSVFLGILKEADKIEPLFFTLLWELGPDFKDDSKGTLQSMADAVGKLQPGKCVEIRKPNIESITLAEIPNQITFDTNVYFLKEGEFSRYAEKILTCANLFFTENIMSRQLRIYLQDLAAIEVSALGPFSDLGKLTSKEKEGFKLLERLLYDIAKHINDNLGIWNDQIKVSDFTDNFNPKKAIQIHTLIQQDPLCVNVEDVFKFNSYLLNCILDKHPNKLVFSDGFDAYAHILFDKEFYTVNKTFAKTNLKDDLDKIKTTFKRLAVPQTEEQQIATALKIMMSDFNTETKRYYVNKVDKYSKKTQEKEKEKLTNIKDAALEALKRNSSIISRGDFFEALFECNRLDGVKDVQTYKTFATEACAAAGFKLKKEEHPTFESIAEYKYFTNEILNGEKAKALGNTTTLRSVQLASLPGRIKPFAMPTSKPTLNKSHADYYVENAAIISVAQKAMLKNINEETIDKFKAAINNIKTYKKDGKEEPLEVSGDWDQYYQDTLMGYAKSLENKASRQRDFKAYKNIELLVKSLRKIKPEPTNLDVFMTKINDARKIVSDLVSPTVKAVITRMPADTGKHYVNEIREIDESLDILQSNLTGANLKTFHDNVETMINLSQSRGGDKESDKWKTYLFEVLKELISMYKPMTLIYDMYTKNTEAILRVYLLMDLLYKTAEKYGKIEISNFVDIEREQLDEDLEKPLLDPVTGGLLFPNDINLDFDDLFGYFESKVPGVSIDSTEFKKQIKYSTQADFDELTMQNNLDILIQYIGQLDTVITPENKSLFIRLFTELKGTIHTYYGKPETLKILKAHLWRSVMLEEKNQKSIQKFSAAINDLINSVEDKETWRTFEHDANIKSLLNLLGQKVIESGRFVDYMNLRSVMNSLIVVWRAVDNNTNIAELEVFNNGLIQTLSSSDVVINRPWTGSNLNGDNKYDMEYVLRDRNKRLVDAYTEWRNDYNSVSTLSDKNVDEIETLFNAYAKKSQSILHELSIIEDKENIERISNTFNTTVKTWIKYYINQTPRNSDVITLLATYLANHLPNALNVRASEPQDKWRTFETQWIHHTDDDEWIYGFFPELRPGVVAAAVAAQPPIVAEGAMVIDPENSF